jgi:hypothetical protein
VFRGDLEAALSRSDRTKGGRPPYDVVLMIEVLVLQTSYTLSDDQTDYQPYAPQKDVRPQCSSELAIKKSCIYPYKERR